MDFSVEELAVSLGRRQVLRGIDARIRAGRITAIVGPNGAGKTTLLRALAGQVDLDAGRVRLGGKLLTRFSASERRRMIGYVPQEPVGGGFVARLLGKREPVSASERAEASLARVLAVERRWLLADEPLASFDPIHQIDTLALLRDAAAKGMGVVVVLHDLLQAARAADDVLLLRGGEMVAFGPASEALAHQPLRDAFGVEVMVIGDSEGRLLPVPIGRVKG